ARVRVSYVSASCSLACSAAPPHLHSFPTRRSSDLLFDFTSFAKIEVRGPGAAEFLERLCDNRVARAVGALTYTQMLNEAGGIERSEEHTSELQSPCNLVCRLLLEKKKKQP